MTFRSIFILPVALSTLALSGCGGSNGSTTPPKVVGGDVALTDMTSRDPSTLQAYGIDTSSGSTSSTTSQRGTLDRSTATGTTDTTGATVDLGSLSGTVSSTDAKGTYVAISGGGTLDILYGSGGEQYVASYTAQSSGGSTTGVIGVPSDATKLPISGSATYSGEATKVEINDESSLYDLSGTSSSTVNFGTSKVSTQLSGLSGTKTDGTVTTNVTNVAVVNLNGAKMVNGAFSGGTASVSGTSSSDTLTTKLSGGQTVTQSGSLYGPNGQEIGGVFIVDDRGAGSGSRLLLQGSYIGMKQ